MLEDERICKHSQYSNNKIPFLSCSPHLRCMSSIWTVPMSWRWPLHIHSIPMRWSTRLFRWIRWRCTTLYSWYVGVFLFSLALQSIFTFVWYFVQNFSETTTCWRDSFIFAEFDCISWTKLSRETVRKQGTWSSSAVGWRWKSRHFTQRITNNRRFWISATFNEVRMRDDNRKPNYRSHQMRKSKKLSVVLFLFFFFIIFQ